MSSSSPPSVYDRMCWPQPMLEQALASGEHRRELNAYLGPTEYALLSQLAQRAVAARRRPGSLSVYLLPGILGSQLGLARSAHEPPDVLWLDPDDIVLGRLAELHPDHPTPLRSLGAIVYNYLPLKLRLSAAGFNVILHDYDWRDDVLASGRALNERLKQDSAESLVLIGHSMGGLLARAALAQYGSGAERIRQFIGIGAPHGGSMAAVQALRATYPVVCRLAAIDQQHDADTLTMNVFRYFLSLYQMLPTETPDLNLYEIANWPGAGNGPDPTLLQLARGFSPQLAPGDTRFISIVGTGQRTVTGLERQDQQFRYEITSAGDGTVAAVRATLPDTRVYSLRCEHSELPRSPTVAAALIDLMRSGRTHRLTEGAAARAGSSVYLTDAAIRRELDKKVDWHKLTTGQRRRYLNQISVAPKSYRSWH